MYWRAPPSYLCHCNCDWLNHTTWSNGNYRPYTMWYGCCHLVSNGPGYVDWLKHTTWFHSNQALPRSMEFEVNIASFFFTIQTPICYVGCLLDRKYMDIYLLIPQEYCYTGKQKKFVFSHISLWTLVTFTFKPCKLCKMFAQSPKRCRQLVSCHRF